ncbi:MAG TPA: prepilin-type N-terminal cleavage/methylation domain-containing protein, partial [Chthoniobacterales bacterium]
MKKSGWGSRRHGAFTLLELLIVLVIIAILGTMLIPVYSGMRTRAQRVQCIANLHSLYLAADVFLQRNGGWPQIKHSSTDTGDADFANAWIDALAPFGPTRQTWICPTIQEIRGNPPYQLPQEARLDYIPMNFDDKPTT